MDLKKGVYYSLLISTPHLREELRLVRQSQQIHAPNDRVISRRRFVDGGGKQGRREEKISARRERVKYELVVRVAFHHKIFLLRWNFLVLAHLFMVATGTLKSKRTSTTI